MWLDAEDTSSTNESKSEGMSFGRHGFEGNSSYSETVDEGKSSGNEPMNQQSMRDRFRRKQKAKARRSITSITKSARPDNAMKNVKTESEGTNDDFRPQIRQWSQPKNSSPSKSKKSKSNFSNYDRNDLDTATSNTRSKQSSFDDEDYEYTKKSNQRRDNMNRRRFNDDDDELNDFEQGDDGRYQSRRRETRRRDNDRHEDFDRDQRRDYRESDRYKNIDGDQDDSTYRTGPKEIRQDVKKKVFEEDRAIKDLRRSKDSIESELERLRREEEEEEAAWAREKAEILKSETDYKLAEIEAYKQRRKERQKEKEEFRKRQQQLREQPAKEKQRYSDEQLQRDAETRISYERRENRTDTHGSNSTSGGYDSEEKDNSGDRYREDEERASTSIKKRVESKEETEETEEVHESRMSRQRDVSKNQNRQKSIWDDVDDESKDEETSTTSSSSTTRYKPDFRNMKKFLTNPLPKSAGIVQCYIVRSKGSFAFTKNAKYVLFMKEFDEKFLLAAKKRSQNKTSNYLISTDRNDLSRDSDSYVGKLRSNFLGTEFVIYDDGENPNYMSEHDELSGKKRARSELGVALYASNVLGSRGPRKMRVAIPEVKGNGDVVIWRSRDPSREGMLKKLKQKEYQDMTIMINKPPRWNEQVGAYVLNFNGRVTMASVKNFQLITPENPDRVVLQFGRVGKHRFTMDVQHPLSPLQAFAICLSSFDYKIACE